MHDDDSWMPWLGFAYGLGLWFAGIPFAADGGGGLIALALWAPIGVAPLFWAGLGYLAATGRRKAAALLLALHYVVAIAAVKAEFSAAESGHLARLAAALSTRRLEFAGIGLFYVIGQVTTWWCLQRPGRKAVDTAQS